MQQQTHRITVVSEGLVFEGHRLPRAFVWREVAAAPDQLAPTPNRTAVQFEYALAYVRNANLSKEDKAHCRRQVSGMTGPQVQRLTAELRRFRRSSSPQ